MSYVPEQRRFRDLARQLSPSWLVGRNGYKLIYCLGLMLDILLDAGWAALKLRFAGVYSLDPLALSKLGVERRLRQGLFEQVDPASGQYSAEGAKRYAKRLHRWWAAFRNRGNPYELLEQLRAYHDPEEAASYQVVYRSGRRYTMYRDGAEWKVAWDDIADYSPDARPEKWARYTVFVLGVPVYHLPTLTPAIKTRALADLRGLVLDFNSAHCGGKIIVSPGTQPGLWSELPLPPAQAYLTPPMSWSYDPDLDPSGESLDKQWSYNGGVGSAAVEPIVVEF